MAEQEYFKSALSDFTYEAASGGAIRHLTDLGYTVRQIGAQLSFPTPYARVQKTVWQRLLETGVILTEEPGSGKTQRQEKAEYVMERDKYGRTSFRRVTATKGGEENGVVCWKERKFMEGGEVAACRQERHAAGSRRAEVPDTERSRRLAVYLAEKCRQNGGDAYLSCGFGLLRRDHPSDLEAMLEALNERQREYIAGLPWEERVCYHKLDQRMQEIAVSLCRAGMLRGTCYFRRTEERVTL